MESTTELFEWTLNFYFSLIGGSWENIKKYQQEYEDNNNKSKDNGVDLSSAKSIEKQQECADTHNKSKYQGVAAFAYVYPLQQTVDDREAAGEVVYSCLNALHAHALWCQVIPGLNSYWDLLLDHSIRTKNQCSWLLNTVVH